MIARCVEPYERKRSSLAVDPAEDTTALLRRWDDPVARERLFEIVYPELRRLAAARLRGERSGHTLQTADLVNEAFLRLVRQGAVNWQGRAHFLAIAARAMKRILLDHARRKLARRRNGGLRVTGAEGDFSISDPFEQLIQIELLLEKLAVLNARVVETFDLHYFGGLTFDQIGAVLEIDPRTAKRDWQMATEWLADAFGPEGRA